MIRRLFQLVRWWKTGWPCYRRWNRPYFYAVAVDILLARKEPCICCMEVDRSERVCGKGWMCPECDFGVDCPAGRCSAFD